MPEFINQFFIDVETIPRTFAGFVQLVFLGGVYGYVLCYASNMIKDGSELLLLVPALAGVVGSIVLPILGAVPDGAIVIFSGLGGNAQEEVSVGVGALAGSTIMLLTVPWCLSVMGGRVNIVNGEPQYTKPKTWAKDAKWAKLTSDSTLFNTGVGCGPTIRRSAVLMLITLIPYFIIQIPAALGGCVWEANFAKCQTPKWAPAIGGVFALVMFIYYLYFQIQQANDDPVKEDKIDEIRKEALRKHLVSLRGLFFAGVKQHVGEGVPLDANDEHFRSCIRPFFNEFDVNNSGTIDRSEFSAVLTRLGESPSAEQLDDLMRAADRNGDGQICFSEFCEAIIMMSREDYVDKTIRDHAAEEAAILALKRSEEERVKAGGTSVARSEKQPLTGGDAAAYGGTEMRAVEDGKPSSKSSPQGEIDDADDEESEEDGEEELEMPEDLSHLSPAEQQFRIIKRACLLMGLGVAIVLIFSDPMVEVMTAMGEHTGIRPFYISFILAPMASNASEVIASYAYSLKKTQKTITISFSSLIGAASMNNTFCLSLFLALIYFRNLEWAFTAETISIVVIELIMFFVAIQRVHKAWTGFAVLALFPISIVLVAGLERIGFD